MRFCFPFIPSGFLAVCIGIQSVCTPALATEASRPVVTLGIGIADVTSLDPHRASLFGDKGIVAEMFNALVRFPPGSANPEEIEPDLAERWEVSPDNKVWTFHLRKGVQFHHGYGELKAKDVVFSLNRAADQNSSSFASNFSVIAKVEALDDYTVQVTLKNPDAAFLGRVSNYHGGNIVSEAAAKKLGAKFGQTPIGTGPFMFDKHVTQQYVKLVANEAYFRGVPKVSGINYRFIPSDSARDLAFAVGELDISAGKREQFWVDTAKRRGTNVDVFDPAEYRTLFLNRNIKPLDDLKVRQAIAAAINVDEIVRFAGKDISDKGCSVIPNGYLGEDCSSGEYQYDVTRAKQLLAEAGYPDGITIKSVVSNVVAQKPIMEVVQAQLAEAGITLQMEVVDHATYQSKIRKDQSGIVFYGAARFPSADYWLSEFYDSAAAIGAPKAMSNFGHCKVADESIREAQVTADPDAQKALWARAQALIHQDVCAIPLFGLKQVWMHSDQVRYGYELKGALNLQPPVTETTTISGKK